MKSFDGNNFNPNELGIKTDVNQIKKKFKNLAIGEWPIFKSKLGTLYIVNKIDQIDTIIEEGDWYISSSHQLIKRITDHDIALYYKIMQEPWPYSSVIRRFIPIATLATVTRAIASLDQFITVKYLSDYNKVKPGTLAAGNKKEVKEFIMVLIY